MAKGKKVIQVNNIRVICQRSRARRENVIYKGGRSQQR
jgi:hypothetical protein